MPKSDPYSLPALALRYLRHRIQGKAVRRLHSPLLFSLCHAILVKGMDPPGSEPILDRKRQLLSDRTLLSYSDPGREGKMVERTVAQICRRSNLEYASRLKARIAMHFKVRRCIELGSSLGLGAAWIRSGMSNGGRLITLEGVPQLAAISRNTSEICDLDFEVREGLFADSLAKALMDLGKVDMVVFDGHHRKAATLQYLQNVLPYCHSETVLVFDDIHWSPEMENCWELIQNMEQIPQTLDLFFMGLAFPYRNAVREQVKIYP